LLLNYHLSVLEVAAIIGKIRHFYSRFSFSACHFEVDSPRSFSMGGLLGFLILIHTKKILDHRKISVGKI